uniref:Uncharacterized protein n=1 Tax=Lepeophtheirus salmonis TaxID=72036 RepID=A0A0K2UPV5_LEPSM
MRWKQRGGTNVVYCEIQEHSRLKPKFLLSKKIHIYKSLLKLIISTQSHFLQFFNEVCHFIPYIYGL